MSGRFIDFGNESERVRYLQEMLRRVGLADGIPESTVAVNGIFDQATEDAVRAVQKEFGLPDSGVYDYGTHQALGKRSEELRRGHDMGIYPFPSTPDYSLGLGDIGEAVSILQLMLGGISMYYDLPHVPMSGRYGKETVEAVKEFQRITGLPETGRVDEATWERLAGEYNRSVNDSQ